MRCSGFSRRRRILVVGFSLFSGVLFAVFGRFSVIRDDATATRYSKITKKGISSSREGAEKKNVTEGIQLFPRWGEESIDLSALLQFVQRLPNRSATTVLKPKPRARFPETLYVVDSQGIWTSRTIRDRTLNMMLKARVIPTERLYLRAWNLLQQSSQHDADGRWGHLRRAVFAADGFPFLAWYGDYKSCNHHNWKNVYSIPLFTVCATVSCPYAFPVPSYQTIQDAQPTAARWQTVMNDYSVQYPWDGSKIRQLVWRGSLSAPNQHWNSTRWMVHVLANTKSTTNTTIAALQERVDIGLVSIGSMNSHQKDLILQWAATNTATTVAFKPPIRPMNDFQRYVAILDMDGNAWSSRFGALLCYNSVVVKIEPDYVDYYFMELTPWKHYVPVRRDLSDFWDAVAFVTDPRNDVRIQEIIQNANDWCQTHLTLDSLAHDLLDIWNAYVSYLDRGGDWSSGQLWANEKAVMFRNAEFDMVPI